jgi:hypothetical protein
MALVRPENTNDGIIGMLDVIRPQTLSIYNPVQFTDHEAMCNEKCLGIIITTVSSRLHIWF